MRARYSTDDVSVATPTWTEVPNSKFRDFTISSGRDSELSEFDAGTATITVDNRDRTFDPNNNALIRPLNRWWLYSEFSGEVHTRFKGYAESYALSYPGWGGSDAEVQVNCSDEFLVLSQGALPTTNPPSESYTALIASDQPDGYWDMSEDSASRTRLPTNLDLAVGVLGGNGLRTASPAKPLRTDLRRSAYPAARRKN